MVIELGTEGSTPNYCTYLWMQVHCAVTQAFNLSVGLRYFQYYGDNVMQVDVLSCCGIKKNRKLDASQVLCVISLVTISQPL